MESFPAYLDAGVNVCLGTDTCPQSMIEAMRWSAVVGKIMSRQTEKSTAADVFNAATLNPAQMLHRDDLGRISAGAKADLLFWDTSSMFMVPLRDPIKNIVYNATADELKDVMIDGESLQAIDFDDCGFGWHLFDLATISILFLGTEQSETVQRAVIDGYRQERQLTDETLAQMPLFYLLRAFTYLGWIHTRSETRTAEEIAPGIVKMVCELAEDYLSAGSAAEGSL